MIQLLLFGNNQSRPVPKLRTRHISEVCDAIFGRSLLVLRQLFNLEQIVLENPESHLVLQTALVGTIVFQLELLEQMAGVVVPLRVVFLESAVMRTSGSGRPFRRSQLFLFGLFITVALDVVLALILRIEPNALPDGDLAQHRGLVLRLEGVLVQRSCDQLDGTLDNLEVPWGRN